MNLHFAHARRKNTHRFWLLRHQADVNIRNKVGETSLTVALLRRHNQATRQRMDPRMEGARKAVSTLLQVSLYLSSRNP